MANINANRKFYILGAILILLLLGVFLAKKNGWIGKKTGTEVTVAKARNANIIEKVSASGKVQPEVEVKISPDVPGEITNLYVEEGDSVTRGQLLLKIRADNYVSVVQMQQAQVNTQRANLAQAKAQLSQTIANSAQTALTHKRNTDLFTQKVISQADFEASKASYEVSRQEIEAARQRVRAAEFNLQSALASLEESRKNLNKTTIYAPVNGTISKLSVEEGERVVGTSQMAGTELLRIANLNSMEVRVNVNENDIIRVQVGDSAIVEVDSYSGKDEKFRGVVTQIANTAKDAVTLEAVTEFEVRIRLINDSFKHLANTRRNATPFRPGMTASVDIITEQKNNILTVPLSAVTTRVAEDGDKKTPIRNTNNTGSTEANEPQRDEQIDEIVFVHRNGKAEAVKVKTGISDFDNIQILSGLKEGDEVISGPFRAVSKGLKNGEVVIVKDEAALAKTGGSGENEEENKD
ncbi:MAG: secretion protein HlyD [Adhaeribacter sp.]|nr:secretion protein HlyD [Adhaeribacter sp.]